MSSFDRKSRDLSSRTRRNVRTVSKESRTIGISCKTCLSFARCVESKQRLNKDIFVLAFVRLYASPIPQVYKSAGMSRASHIALIANLQRQCSGWTLYIAPLLFLGASVALSRDKKGEISLIVLIVKTSGMHNVRTRFAPLSSFHLPKIHSKYSRFNITYNGPNKLWNELEISLESFSS